VKVDLANIFERALHARLGPGPGSYTPHRIDQRNVPTFAYLTASPRTIQFTPVSTTRAPPVGAYDVDRGCLSTRSSTFPTADRKLIDSRKVKEVIALLLHGGLNSF
jgi:hypothetical protein